MFNNDRSSPTRRGRAAQYIDIIETNGAEGEDRTPDLLITNLTIVLFFCLSSIDYIRSLLKVDKFRHFGYLYIVSIVRYADPIRRRFSL